MTKRSRVGCHVVRFDDRKRMNNDGGDGCGYDDGDDSHHDYDES